MSRQLELTLLVLALIAIVAGVDVAFFRNRFWARLTVNIVLVLVFAVFYFRYFRQG